MGCVVGMSLLYILFRAYANYIHAALATMLSIKLVSGLIRGAIVFVMGSQSANKGCHGITCERVGGLMSTYRVSLSHKAEA